MMNDLPEGSRFIGITSDVDKVVEIALDPPDGFALAVDFPLIKRQAMALAGEDQPLAMVLSFAALKSLGLHTGLVFDDYGMCLGPVEEHAQREFDGDTRYVHGAQTGACGMLLALIKNWPGDPLKCGDMALHEVEEHVITLMGDVARRLGIEETL